MDPATVTAIVSGLQTVLPIVVGPGERLCTGPCGEVKPLDLFREGRTKDRKTRRCKACRALQKKTAKEANPEPSKAYEKDYRQRPKGRYGSYRSGAKKRNLSFDLSFEQFMTLWQLPCGYCGDSIGTVGIDRIDSSVGYQLDNCKPCCHRCNEMKMDHSLEDWIAQMKKILNHLEVS